MANQQGKMNIVSLQELADTLESAQSLESVDLGSAMIVRGHHTVTGDFIAISTSDGHCALIRP